MLVEICRRLSEFAPLSDYRYVGLGGLEFVDFDLMHRALDIADMVSIERDTASIARYEFNIPFKTVKILGGTASEQLALLDWSPLSIVWLDYECQLNRAVLDEDIALLCAGLQPGSALFVTLNAMPTRAMAGRRDQLVSSVGENRVPPGVMDEILAVWGLAGVQYRILSDAIVEGLRNRPMPARWKQVLNIHYADDARMQTIGGMVYTAAMQRTVEQCRFSELDFVREGAESFALRVPMLTHRERLYLESQLPLKSGETLSLPGLSDDDKEAFLAVYRYQRAVGAIV
jgi:hypothetical protein